MTKREKNRGCLCLSSRRYINKEYAPNWQTMIRYLWYAKHSPVTSISIAGFKSKAGEILLGG